MEAGLLDEHGRLLQSPVDVERIAENRGLRIVGAEPHGHLRLPRWRKGEIRIHTRLLLVRADLLDEDTKEGQLCEVIAHEVSHDVLHGCHAAQRPLPFGSIDTRRLALGRMSFGSTAKDTFEREAIYLGALIQVPVIEMQSVIAPHIKAYADGDWTFATSAIESLERSAATLYSRRCISSLAEAFGVTPRTAKITLDYWDALNRPPRAWQSEVLGALKTSPR